VPCWDMQQHAENTAANNDHPTAVGSVTITCMYDACLMQPLHHQLHRNAAHMLCLHSRVSCKQKWAHNRLTVARALAAVAVA
jgi:hypothetical protein